MNLDPDDGNEMFGRSLFRMHGDNAAMNHTASDGCIIMGLAVRLEVAEACGWRVSLIPEFAVAEVTPTSEGKIQVVG